MSKIKELSLSSWCDNVKTFAHSVCTSPNLSHLIYYTDHSFEHSERDINYCNYLLSFIPNVTQTERDVLTCSAYLHDIALFVDRKVASEMLRKYLFISVPESEEETLGMKVREYHHILACEWLKDNNSVNYFSMRQEYIVPSIPQHLRTAIARCIRAHRFTTDNAFNDLLQSEQYNNYPTPDDGEIRLRLLGAVLRLADELDISYRKVNQSGTKKPQGIEELFWHFHIHIAEVFTDNKGNITIKPKVCENVVSAEAKDLIQSICQYHYDKIYFEYTRLLEMEIPYLPKITIYDQKPNNSLMTEQADVPPLSYQTNTGLFYRMVNFTDKMNQELNRKSYTHKRRDLLIKLLDWLKTRSENEIETISKLSSLRPKEDITLQNALYFLRYVDDPLLFEHLLDDMEKENIWNLHVKRSWYWTEQQLILCREALTAFRKG
jgi:hypothetical protein